MSDYLEDIQRKIDEKKVVKQKMVTAVTDYVQVATTKELIEIMDLINTQNSR